MRYFLKISMRVGYSRMAFFLGVAVLCFAFGVAWSSAAQEPAKPAEKQAEQKAETKSAGVEKKSVKVELPFQIQLLETHVRFEKNGDSRKEVHTIVRINNVLGAREFARLAFDYNRGWQQVEIPLVRVSHANGGTSELLPSAVTDAVNSAVEKFPAYQDVRVKSARILGLQEGDTIEYRVITTTTKPPLAPEFWLEHTFDRSGQVLEENYEIDLPSSRPIRIRVSPEISSPSVIPSGEGESKRTIYEWKKIALTGTENEPRSSAQPDMSLTTFVSWNDLAKRLEPGTPSGEAINDQIRRKAKELAGSTSDSDKQMSAYYEFVRTQIKIVDLPLEAMGFQYREASDVLTSGYGTVTDKFMFLRKLAAVSIGELQPVFISDHEETLEQLPIPSHLVNMVAAIGMSTPVPPGQGCGGCVRQVWLDIGLDVAPYGMVRAAFRGKLGLLPEYKLGGDFGTNPIYPWLRIPNNLPFPSRQKVTVDTSLSREGTLTSTVKYVMRGDNELLLREAFHGTAKEKWKDVANLLAISDGFRGEISSVNVSDPLATREPFKVEYTITQAKFVDWSKKPVRIPALLPQIGLPDLPRKAAEGEAAPKIELGTPLDVETQMTLKLPAGTKAVVPAGTAVNRDYARFESKYGGVGETVTASRRVNFLLREIDGTRGMDYNAFVRAVQNDQAGLIVLERDGSGPR